MADKKLKTACFLFLHLWINDLRSRLSTGWMIPRSRQPNPKSALLRPASQDGSSNSQLLIFYSLTFIYNLRLSLSCRFGWIIVFLFHIINCGLSVFFFHDDIYTILPK